MANCGNTPARADGCEEYLLEIRFSARPDRLKLIRKSVQGAAEMCGFDRPTAEDVMLAVDEACTNVIRHAYKGGSGEAVLTLWCRDDAMHVRLRDFAPAVDQLQLMPRNRRGLRAGGFGVRLMHEIMDQVSFSRAGDDLGNVLEMSKRVERNL